MGLAPSGYRRPGLVVDVWLSRATYLDVSSIRDSSPRDHPALSARGPGVAECFRRRNGGSASKLLPSCPLVFWFIPGSARGQSREERRDERRFARTFRPEFSCLLDRRVHYRG